MRTGRFPEMRASVGPPTSRIRKLSAVGTLLYRPACPSFQGAEALRASRLSARFTGKFSRWTRILRLAPRRASPGAFTQRTNCPGLGSSGHFRIGLSTVATSVATMPFRTLAGLSARALAPFFGASGLSFQVGPPSCIWGPIAPVAPESAELPCRRDHDAPAPRIMAWLKLALALPPAATRSCPGSGRPWRSLTSAAKTKPAFRTCE